MSHKEKVYLDSLWDKLFAFQKATAELNEAVFQGHKLGIDTEKYIGVKITEADALETKLSNWAQDKMEIITRETYKK